MAIEPPPNIMKAGRLPGKIRTGAKTATKDQEREYLARFEALAKDPSRLLPHWRGKGGDPFASWRRKLSKISSRRASERWLRWYARGKKLPNAYANTLLVLRAGKIPSFAAMKFQGRDVKYVLRGRGQGQKLIAVQNHDDAQVRLIGFLDVARRKRIVLVSTPTAFYAQEPGTPVPADEVAAILADGGPEALVRDERVECPHAGGGHWVMEYEAPDVAAKARLCRDCIQQAGGTLAHRLERNILAPAGTLRVHQHVAGRPLDVHPESAAGEFSQLLSQADADAHKTAKEYTNMTDLDLLDWATEAFAKRLEERPGGYLWVDRDLWLGSFPEAAQRFGTTDLERRALEAAFSIAPPRLRTSEPSLHKLLAPLWKERGGEIVRRLCGDALNTDEILGLVARSPGEALQVVARRLQTLDRFRGFPAFEELPEPLRLTYDLFKAQKTGDHDLFRTRLGQGVQGRDTRSLALALARAYNAAAGLEWQYTALEKDQAAFLEPYVRNVAQSTAETLEAQLGGLAAALNLAPPRRRA